MGGFGVSGGADTRWRFAAVCAATAGTDRWRAWWARRQVHECVRVRDAPVQCSGCRTAATVLACEHRCDELGHPQIERWCRCVSCGDAWREVTTIVGGEDQALPRDVEGPWRLRVLEHSIAAAVIGGAEQGEQQREQPGGERDEASKGAG